MTLEATTVESVFDGEQIRANNRRIDTDLLEAIEGRLPREGPGRRWPTNVSFDDSTFVGSVSFARAIFPGGLGPSFARAKFTGDANFSETWFNGNGQFLEASFRRTVDFSKARFEQNAYFSKASFGERVIFDGATVNETAAFEAATFKKAPALGPFVALLEVLLWESVFEESVEISIAAPFVDATRLQLRKGGTLRLRWAETDLASASFAAPALLTGAEELHLARWIGGPLDESALLEKLGQGSAGDWRPVLVSLRHADAANLEIASADLRRCMFASARNLEKLRLLPSAELARTPGWRKSRPAVRPPSWMWTRRRMIADEYRWRLKDTKVRERWVAQLAGGSRPWPKPEFAGLESRRHQEEASAADVAGLYRQLRKGREEAKDEPGAADFYYGEAEMRRHARETPAGERVILWMYWLTSGYGLRASRALIALAITVVLFALAFDLWGLDRQPFWRALLLSAQSTTSLFRPPSRPALTAEGEALQLVLRLLGPLFFGLALLSLRGRVKR